jgi:filamentous hemagglutinin family protein
MQNGSTLNVLQTTPQALVNFQTFNVGSGAVVDIRQPGASRRCWHARSAASASQIYGQIKANGALWLINPAGIMVGAGARIDVGSFVASTLNVSDSDFLAGRLTFKAGVAVPRRAKCATPAPSTPPAAAASTWWRRASPTPAR